MPLSEIQNVKIKIISFFIKFPKQFVTLKVTFGKGVF